MAVMDQHERDWAARRIEGQVEASDWAHSYDARVRAAVEARAVPWRKRSRAQWRAILHSPRA